ncbi:MAG: hypothetical protein U0T82_10470 [Bacteroidales bacterium]
MRALLLTLLLPCLSLYSQDFPAKSLGVRGGEMSGITYRHLKTDYTGSELLLSFRDDGLQATFLRQKLRPTLGELGKNFWFVNGYGLHAGFTYENEFNVLFSRYIYEDKKLSPLLGVDGYLGLEYRFREIPLSMGIDYKPYFEFSGYDFFSIRLWDTAFMIKYNFD